MFIINLVHWNCFKLTEIRLFELELYLKKFKPDIVSLQELKLFNEDANYKLRFEGYSAYHKSRIINPDKGGGVAFLVNDRINHSSFSDVDFLSMTNCEIVGITVELENFKCNIFSYYNTPKDLLNSEFFMNLLDRDENFLVVGDLNAKTPVVGCRSIDSSGRVLEKLLMDTDLVVFNNNVNTYTRFGSDYEEILDLIIGSSSLVGNISGFEVLNEQSLLISDHYPIKINISGNGEFISNSGPPDSRFNFAKADWYSFQNFLTIKADTYSNTFLNSLGVDDFNSLITTDILKAANLTIPKFEGGRIKTFPGVILDLIRKRREFRKVLKKNRTDLNKKNFNEISNLVKSKIKEYKEKKWFKVLEGVGDYPVSSRIFWREINKTKSPKQSSSIPNLKIDQTYYKTDMEKVSLFSSILSNTFTDNVNNTDFDMDFRSVAENLVNNLDTNNCKVDLFITRDIYKVLSKLKNSSSPGPDGIFNIFIKKLPFEYIRKVLLKLLNLTLYKGMPFSWKIANITMIPKKVSKSKDPGDYRPISMTSCLGKLCERIMKTRLYSFLEEKNIFAKQQSGFRNNKGASDNLVFCTQKLCETINKDRNACGIFFDISKAFDKVWHVGLVYKLMELGIEKYMIRFILNFLANRSFRVKLNKVEGELFPIKCGVPQGSVLGPLLFLVFINDIPIMEERHLSYSSLFADDLAVFFLFQDPKKLGKKINKYLESLVSWLFKWRLKMNATKCCYTIFSKSGNRKNIKFVLKLGKDEIPYNPKPLFLGITFDENLCFNEHFKNLEERAYKRLNIIKIIRHKSWGLSYKTLTRIFLSLIGSIFAYSFFTLANVSITNLNKLQIIQNKAVRLIYRLDWNSLTSSLSGISNILDVRDRLLQLGCRSISKSLSLNCYTGELIQEYLGSVSKITKDRNRKTVLCLFYPLIALAYACQIFLLLFMFSCSLCSTVPSSFRWGMKFRKFEFIKKFISIII